MPNPQVPFCVERMKKSTPILSWRFAVVVGLCSLAAGHEAAAQNELPENAQALLEKVKRHDLDRQIAAKQTALDRLAQDLAKEHKEAEAVQQSIDSTGNLHKAGSAALEQLVNDKKRLEQVLELTALRIEAERLKVDGLQKLADAQAKTLSAVTKRAEATDARASLGAAEFKLLSENTPEPTGKGRSPLADLRKKVATSESAADIAERVAADAMRTASLRLEQADVASVRAKRKAGGMEGDLPPIAEKPLDLDPKETGIPKTNTKPQ